MVTASEALGAVLQYPRGNAGPVRGPVIRVPWRRQQPTRRYAAALRLPVLSSICIDQSLRAQARDIADRIDQHETARHIDAVLATSPPPLAIYVGAEIARRRDVPFVTDMRDPWTFYMCARYRSRLDFHFQKSVEAAFHGDAARVIANTPAAARQLMSELGVPERKISVIHNGFDAGLEDALVENYDRSCVPSTLFTIVYVGLTSVFPRSGRGLKARVKSLIGIDVSPVQADEGTRSPVLFLEACRRAAAESPEFARDVRGTVGGAASRRDSEND